jgi:hypothetical protein
LLSGPEKWVYHVANLSGGEEVRTEVFDGPVKLRTLLDGILQSFARTNLDVESIAPPHFHTLTVNPPLPQTVVLGITGDVDYFQFHKITYTPM